MKTDNTDTNTKAKTTGRVALTGVTIAVVTLALVTAGIVVVISMMVPTIIQKAYASCITSPKGDQACSGGRNGCGSTSCSTSQTFPRGYASAGSGGTRSGGSGAISTFGGRQHVSTSDNFAGLGNCADKTCSGPK